MKQPPRERPGKLAIEISINNPIFGVFEGTQHGVLKSCAIVFCTQATEKVPLRWGHPVRLNSFTQRLSKRVPMSETLTDRRDLRLWTKSKCGRAINVRNNRQLVSDDSCG